MACKTAPGVQNVGTEEALLDRYWHSPLLGFYDVQLEAKYRAFFAGGTSILDKKACSLQIVLLVALQAALIWRCRDPAIDDMNGFYWPIICNFLASSLHGLWMLTSSLDNRLQWRNAATTAVRFTYMITSCVGSVHYKSTSLEDKGLGWWFWWRCIAGSGVLSSNWVSFSLPLMFKHHLYLHTLNLLLQLKWVAPQLCLAAGMPYPDKGGSLGCEGSGTWTNSSSSCAMPCSSMAQMTSLYDWLREATLSLSPWSLEPHQNDPVPVYVCMGSVLFLQLALGWFLPTALLYIVERKSRVYFLLSVERASVKERDLFMLEVEREIEQSSRLVDRACCAMWGLISMSKCTWFVIVAWQLLLWWWAKLAGMGEAAV